MAKGVKHYTRDGTVWKGAYHKMPDGSLHSNKTHTKTSVKLYHYGDLTDKAKKKARSQRKMAVGGVVRDYASEYANYHSSAEQKQNRASRNAARRIAKNNGQNVTGKDVAHKNGNPKDNRAGNLTTKTASQNRSYPRTKTAGKRNPYA